METDAPAWQARHREPDDDTVESPVNGHSSGGGRYIPVKTTPPATTERPTAPRTAPETPTPTAPSSPTRTDDVEAQAT